MSGADLESAILEGRLANLGLGPSPPRGASAGDKYNDEGHTDDELGSDLSRPTSPLVPSSHSESNHNSAYIPEHDGPRTGPKGVSADSRAAAEYASERRRQAIADTRRSQERRAITALTVHEEEALRAHEAKEKDRRRRGRAGSDDDDDGDKHEHEEDADSDDEETRKRWRARRLQELRKQKLAMESVSSLAPSGGRGGLREVGKEGFVNAVERDGWVVVLIYEPDIARCQELLASMTSIARSLPRGGDPISLIRARATSLQFSLLPAEEAAPTARKIQQSRIADGEVLDYYELEDEDDEEDNPLGQPDPDVLPTVLAYKDGDLVHNWVRVDFELGTDGFEGLLRREGILPSTATLQRDNMELYRD